MNCFWLRTKFFLYFPNHLLGPGVGDVGVDAFPLRAHAADEVFIDNNWNLHSQQCVKTWTCHAIASIHLCVPTFTPTELKFYSVMISFPFCKFYNRRFLGKIINLVFEIIHDYSKFLKSQPRLSCYRQSAREPTCRRINMSRNIVKPFIIFKNEFLSILWV